MDAKLVVDKIGRKRLLDGFIKYSKFKKVAGMGSNWRGEVMSYFPVGDWIASASVYQVLLWGFKIDWIPIWIVFVILIVKFYVMIIVHYFVGKFGVKIGLLKAQAQVDTKVEELNPVNQEFLKTMKSICEKTGADYYFTELDEKPKKQDNGEVC